MKKTNITIQYDEEKLETLNVYLGDKNMSINDELCKCVDALYNKLVPPAVRDFFSKKIGGTPAKKPVNNTRNQTSKKSPQSETEAQN